MCDILWSSLTQQLHFWPSKIHGMRTMPRAAGVTRTWRIQRSAGTGFLWGPSMGAINHVAGACPFLWDDHFDLKTSWVWKIEVSKIQSNEKSLKSITKLTFGFIFRCKMGRLCRFEEPWRDDGAWAPGWGNIPMEEWQGRPRLRRLLLFFFLVKHPPLLVVKKMNYTKDGSLIRFWSHPIFLFEVLVWHFTTHITSHFFLHPGDDAIELPSEYIMLGGQKVGFDAGGSDVFAPPFPTWVSAAAALPVPLPIHVMSAAAEKSEFCWSCFKCYELF